MSDNTSLMLLSRANIALIEANTIIKAKDLMDKALTVSDWLKRKKASGDIIQKANTLALEAQRKMGQMLLEKPPARGAGPGRGKQGIPQSPCLSDIPSIADLGLTKRESSEAQMLATIPRQEFDDLKNGKTTVKNIKKSIRLARSKSKEKKALSELPKNTEWIVTEKQSVVECSALITDPPYGIMDEPWEPEKLESFTREWLERWNKCGADIILSFWSQRYLFTGRTWFDESMPNYEFQQLLIWHYPNNKKPQSRTMFKQTWEPIYFYRRMGSDRKIISRSTNMGGELNEFDCHVAAVPQSNFNDAGMKQHPAQKPVSVMKWLINATTEPGELVCDPFAGSGTTGIACVQLKRMFHGIETDPAFLKLARERIATYGV